MENTGYIKHIHADPDVKLLDDTGGIIKIANRPMIQ
jgi:hypothetical protein